MAARQSRGRKAPKRKHDRYLVRGSWITVRYFKGYELRHTQPDLDIFFWQGDGSVFSHIAKPRTLYIDAAYRAEEAFLVRMYEIQTMRKWTTRGDNKRCPPYQTQRKTLKEMLCLPGPVPEYIERKEHDEDRQLDICYVRGDIVRQYLDPHFVFGGHDLIYPEYIPKRTVWVDVVQDDREKKYSLAHELRERELMETRGWTYNRAHAAATRFELALRLEEYDVKRPLRPKLRPLPVVAIVQETDAGCGPTALEALLSHDNIRRPDGQAWTEADLIARSGCDPHLGTDHLPLESAVRSIVGDAFTVGENGTIEDLRRLVLEERRPVLVGWWNGPHRTPEEVRADPGLDEGHYGVVKHVTTHVWLADSWIVHREGPGDHKVRLKEFMERWYDMDGTPSETDPGYRRVNGWYLYLHAPKKEPT